MHLNWYRETCIEYLRQFEDIRKKGIGQEDKVVSGTLTNILLDQIQTRHPQTCQQSKYKLVIR